MTHLTHILSKTGESKHTLKSNTLIDPDTLLSLHILKKQVISHCVLMCLKTPWNQPSIYGTLGHL